VKIDKPSVPSTSLPCAPARLVDFHLSAHGDRRTDECFEAMHRCGNETVGRWRGALHGPRLDSAIASHLQTTDAMNARPLSPPSIKLPSNRSRGPTQQRDTRDCMYSTAKTFVTTHTKKRTATAHKSYGCKLERK